MPKPKKTLYHSELVNLGPVEVEIKSDVLASQYRGQNDYVILVLDGFDRNYSCENDDCADAMKDLKGQFVIIEATGSRDDAQIIVSEPTQRPQHQNSRTPDRDSERATGRQRERATPQNQRQSREEAPPREERRRETQRPAPTTQQRRYQPLGVTVGMAINNACQYLIAQGKPLEPKTITEIASDILRVAKWLEAGNLIPKAGPTKEPTTQQKPPVDKPNPADQTQGQSRNAEAPQPGPHEPPPDDDVPF